MRYIEVLEAVQRNKTAAGQNRARSAREQLAAAEKKRGDAARRYQDELTAARDAAARARTKLRSSSVSEAVLCPHAETVDLSMLEGCRSFGLRDRHGVLLGWIEAVGRLLQAKDRTGTIIGWYDPRQNVTRDKCGKLVGTGDLLSALVVCRK